MDQKIVNIQAVRAVAALAVLASHLHAFEAARSAAPLLPSAMFYGFAGVDLFFAVSGFVMVLVTRGRFGRPREAGAFLFSRAWRIYPPYLLFTAIALVGVAAIGEWDERLAASPLVPSLTLWPIAPALPVLQVGWTLTHELYFYLVFALMLLAPQRLLPVLLALWGVIVLGGWMAGAGGAGSVALVAFNPMTLEFIAGAFAGLLVASGRRRLGWPALAAGSLGLVAGSLWLGPELPAAFEDYARRTLAYGLPCALTVYGAACVEVDRGAKASAAWVALGDWSYSLYLLHFILLAGLARLWADRIAGPWDNLGFVLAGAGLSILCAWLSFRYFERPVLRLGALLRGRLSPTRAEPPGATPRLASRIW